MWQQWLGSGKVEAKGHQGNTSFGNFSGGPWLIRVMADERYLLLLILESVNVECSVIMMLASCLRLVICAAAAANKSIERCYVSDRILM